MGRANSLNVADKIGQRSTIDGLATSQPVTGTHQRLWAVQQGLTTEITEKSSFNNILLLTFRTQLIGSTFNPPTHTKCFDPNLRL